MQSTSMAGNSIHLENVKVPDSIQIKSFLNARINEIEALTELIETPNTNMLLKHRFPKHLRRRAMSQNVKRIPKRLREHKLEMMEKSGIKGAPTKRPSRKYRRRPKNLLDDYNRRQKKFVWLETHIWHAKRFNMVEKWGYKLPYFPYGRTFRACYRATSSRCLIQDISYYVCIELSGLFDEILEGLQNHMNVDCGQTFNSSSVQRGSTEGNVMFYNSGKYPYGAIGDVSFIWQPSEPSEHVKTLWIWCHPCFYVEVIKALKETFALEEQVATENLKIMEEDEGMNEPPSKKFKRKNVEAKKLETRNVPFMKTPKYYSTKNSIKMYLLKDTLNRFRLTGPLSQKLMSSVFKEIDLKKRTISDWSIEYKNKIEINELQLQFWKKIKSIMNPCQLPPKLVLGLIVVDVRFTMPALGRILSIHQNPTSDSNAQSLTNIDEVLSFSPIWSSKVRDEVAKTKLSSHRINELRSEKLVPGFEVESNDDMNDFPALPCMFVQRPGSHTNGKPLGYGGGWDIIVPAGYGMPVWLGLVMHGGWPGGLKETESILREAGHLYLAPDTLAGKLESDGRRKEATDNYFKLPPAKRLNYVKLGFKTPFHCPWNVLISDWTNGEQESFFVLRNLRKLQTLNKKLKEKSASTSFDFEQIDSTALVGVIVTLIGKGNVLSNAYICIPSKGDLQGLKENPGFDGPVEESYKDHLYHMRRLTLETHETQIKRLVRKRHKEKNEQKEVDESLKSTTLVKEHTETMKRLWLPECTSVKDGGCRTVIGFICDGDFSFTSSKGSGVGYVSLKALLNLMKLVVPNRKKTYVLIRNHNSPQYRFGQICIICP